MLGHATPNTTAIYRVGSGRRRGGGAAGGVRGSPGRLVLQRDGAQVPWPLTTLHPRPLVFVAVAGTAGDRVLLAPPVVSGSAGGRDVGLGHESQDAQRAHDRHQGRRSQERQKRQASGRHQRPCWVRLGRPPIMALNQADPRGQLAQPSASRADFLSPRTHDPAPPHASPAGEHHGGSQRLGHGIGQGLHLGDGEHGPLGGTVAAAAPPHRMPQGGGQLGLGQVSLPCELLEDLGPQRPCPDRWKTSTPKVTTLGASPDDRCEIATGS